MNSFETPLVPSGAEVEKDSDNLTEIERDSRLKAIESGLKLMREYPGDADNAQRIKNIRHHAEELGLTLEDIGTSEEELTKHSAES